MKRYLSTILLVFPGMIALAQYNIPADSGEEYCHHLKAALGQARSYYEPATVNPLMQGYDVTFYFLDLNVENNTTYISGNVTIKARAISWLDSLAFELYEGMMIDSVIINNNVIYNPPHVGDLVRIPFEQVLNPGEFFTAKIFYHGTPPSGDFFAGVTTDYNTDFQKNVTWTLSEPYAAKDWWPTKQDLNDKADSVWVFLTTSAENMAGSQGLLTTVTPMPGGKARYEWKSYYPIDYYLISFAVADYQEYNLYAHAEGKEDSVFIQNFIYDDPDCLAANKNGIDRTASFMELFSDLFGPYPFMNEKYGHCQAELGGGMEHQTMTTIGGFSFTLVAHELGHSWFGDKVTCATWSDIWINEGFATYCDYLAHSFLADPIYDSIWLKVRHDHVKQQPGGSVYVPYLELADPWRIFDGRLSYSKGALILHMIRFELQDDGLFFDILKTFVEEYGDSTATGNDFCDWLELKSGRDFHPFFTQWYYGEGYPVYNIVWNQTDNILNIYSTQTTSTNVTNLFKMTVPFHLEFNDGTDTTLLFYQNSNQVHFSFPVTKPIEKLELDPEQWILHQLNSITVGIEETANPVHFSIGPNPAKDYVKVFFSNQPARPLNYSITDVSGRILLTGNLESAINTVDISIIPAGLYILTVDSRNNRLNKRLIIE
jgi:aminopeptidase N